MREGIKRQGLGGGGKTRPFMATATTAWHPGPKAGEAGGGRMVGEMEKTIAGERKIQHSLDYGRWWMEVAPPCTTACKQILIMCEKRAREGRGRRPKYEKKCDKEPGCHSRIHRHPFSLSGRESGIISHSSSARMGGGNANTCVHIQTPYLMLTEQGRGPFLVRGEKMGFWFEGKGRRKYRSPNNNRLLAISKGERGREGVSQAEEAKVMDVERIQNNRGGRGFWRRGEASGAALRGCQNRLVRLRREEDDSMEK